MKGRYQLLSQVVLLIVALPLLLISAVVSAIRIPLSTDPIRISGEIEYKFIDVDQSYRGLIERYLLNNRRVRLTTGEQLYVSAKDYRRLWEVSPHEMRKLGYTLVGTFSARELLIGAVGFASLKSVEKIDKLPEIRK